MSDLLAELFTVILIVTVIVVFKVTVLLIFEGFWVAEVFSLSKLALSRDV